MKTTNKLTILLLIAGLLPLAIVTYTNYTSSLKNMTNDIVHHLTESLNYRTKIIGKYTSEIKESVRFDATSPLLINKLKHPKEFLKNKENKKIFTSFLEHQVKTHHYYKTMLISSDGIVLNSSLKESDLGTNLVDGLYKDSELAKSFRMAAELRQPYISDFSYYSPSNKISAFAISPIFDDSKIIGAFCFQLNIDELYSLLEDYDELGKTGEIIVASKVDNKALFLNPLRNDREAPFERHVKIGSKSGIPIQKAVNGGSGNGIYDDYKKEKVIATWGYIPDLRLGMVLKIDTKEAFEKIVQMRNTTIFIGLIALAIFLYVLWFVRKMILRAEQKSEQYAFAIDGINDGLWDWNLKTNEVYFSPRWKEILGYTDNELPNKLSSWKDNIHPNDLEKTLQAVKDSNSNKYVKFNEIHRLKHKDGHWVWILGRGQTIFDNNGKPVRMAGFQTDISETKKLEKKLRASQKQFESFMENIPACVIIKDKNRKVTYANKYTKTFFNDTNIVGLKADELLSEEEAKNANRIDDYIIEHGYIDDTSKYTDFNNEKKTFHTMGFLLKDKQIGLIVFDKTQEMKNQQQLKNQEEIMISQSRHAAMGEMISMIAHQWRQPISIIGMGANNIIADIDLDIVENDVLKKYASDITAQTKELSNTIDDFRNFFKPNKDLEEVLIEKIFHDSLSVIGKSLTNHGIEVTLDIRNTKTITTYPRELMQVFINILKNAKEALVENGVENSKISIIVDEEDYGAYITICDNAGGIKNENINKVFNPYFSTKNEKNGTGLGLYMSKTIIEKHLFGTLKVYNQDSGACFEIKLPYNPSKEGNNE